MLLGFIGVFLGSVAVEAYRSSIGLDDLACISVAEENGIGLSIEQLSKSFLAMPALWIVAVPTVCVH